MTWNTVATTSRIKTATQVTTQGKENSFRHRRLMHGVNVATKKQPHWNGE